MNEHLQQNDTYQTAKDEYSEVCLNIRHYSSLRFAVLTVFFAITAGIASMSFGIGFSSLPSGSVSFLSKVVGFVISVSFGLLEARIRAYVNHFQSRAKDLEKILRFKQWQSLPKVSSVIKGDIIAILIYSIISLFWVIVIIVSL